MPPHPPFASTIIIPCLLLLLSHCKPALLFPDTLAPPILPSPLFAVILCPSCITENTRAPQIPPPPPPPPSHAHSLCLLILCPICITAAIRAPQTTTAIPLSAVFLLYVHHCSYVYVCANKLDRLFQCSKHNSLCFSASGVTENLPPTY